jgi:hypothetical protein
MDKQLTLTEKTVYGQTAYYPACDLSRLLCAVANTKQFTQHIIQAAKTAGYTISVAPVASKTI